MERPDGDYLNRAAEVAGCSHKLEEVWAYVHYLEAENILQGVMLANYRAPLVGQFLYESLITGQSPMLKVELVNQELGEHPIG